MRRRDRTQRKRMGLRGNSSVNLISMMDILTVLLLFLLKSYVAGGEVMVPPPGVELPKSSAESPPQTSVVVAIDQDEILVGNERVTSIAEVVGDQNPEIGSLSARLQAVRQQQDEIARLQGSSPATNRIATIQGDRKIEFRLLRKVMYTLHQNGYDNISLAVITRS